MPDYKVNTHFLLPRSLREKLDDMALEIAASTGERSNRTGLAVELLTEAISAREAKKAIS